MAWERSQDIVQAIVDHAPKATWYYSDALDVYATLWYHWGRYAISEGKADTYSVEGNNAELRHYLARLARSSRCFSRCPYALHCAVEDNEGGEGEFYVTGRAEEIIDAARRVEAVGWAEAVGYDPVDRHAFFEFKLSYALATTYEEGPKRERWRADSAAN